MALSSSALDLIHTLREEIRMTYTSNSVSNNNNRFPISERHKVSFVLQETVKFHFMQTASLLIPTVVPKRFQELKPVTNPDKIECIHTKLLLESVSRQQENTVEAYIP